MNRPNILMIHRVKLNSTHYINELYYKRKMVVELEYLFEIIEKLLSAGNNFGSIEQCIKNNKYFHLSFDDGFNEHLKTAYILKEKYQIPYEAMTFSINVGNSIYDLFSGMDVVYQLIKINKIQLLLNYLKIPKISEIPEIKEKLLILKPDELFRISEELKNELGELNKMFLSKKEIQELSKLFIIASHGISHRDLTANKEYSKQEILKSKQELEHLINKKVDVFCYPEGKNDTDIQNYIKTAGYKYGLSIRDENNNQNCIGRKII